MTYDLKISYSDFVDKEPMTIEGRANMRGQETGIATDEDIALIKARIGTERPVVQTNESATKDAIRHFADGIGDPNPLWRDESYATNSRYGCLIAPPTFLNAILPAQWHEGFLTLRAFVAGCEWEWHQPIKVNDKFTVTNIFDDITVKRDAPVGRRLFLQSGRMNYINQYGEITGVCRWTNIQSEFSGEKQGVVSDKLKGQGRYVYTQKELDAIEQAYNEEEIRGSNPRYWEDVAVGDEIRPVVKGPTNYADMVAFFLGIGGIWKAHSLSVVRSDLEKCWRDPQTNVWIPRGAVHFFDEVAHSGGVPAAYDLGIQRLCWLGHMITNWMGDDGFLKKLAVQFRAINFLGNTTWCQGKVSRKYVKNDEHLVECDIWNDNQKGETIDTGHATLALPSRSGVV
jgi:acyl dehydratase